MATGNSMSQRSVEAGRGACLGLQRPLFLHDERDTVAPCTVALHRSFRSVRRGVRGTKFGTVRRRWVIRRGSHQLWQ